MLAPTLAVGDSVIMDSLAAHKVAGVPDAIEAVGAELRYLPPYSPDLNPIEQAFAKLTRRSCAKTAERSLDALSCGVASANSSWNHSAEPTILCRQRPANDPL